MTRLMPWAPLALSCVLLAVACGLGLAVPLGYDEAYNLQVASHLAESGTYATDGSLYAKRTQREFDVLISTGPTLLIPAGSAFAIFGEDLAVARGVALLGYLGMIVAASMVAMRISGPHAVAPTILGLLALNTQVDWPRSVMFGPADVLGEHTAAAFLLLSALLLQRRPGLAGGAIALAVLTKFIALMAIPSFLVALVVSRQSNRWKALGGFSLGLTLPVLAWNLWRWVELGTATFGRRVSEFLQFAASAGSGINPREEVVGVGTRMSLMTELWHLPALPLFALVLAVLSLIFRRQRTVRGQLPSEVDEASTAMVRAICVAALTMLTWWVLISDTAYGRHLILAPTLATPLIAGWLAGTSIPRPAKRLSRPLWLVCSVSTASVLVTCVLLQIQALANSAGPSLNAQRQAARALAGTGLAEFTFHGAWWQAPEVAFLSGTTAVPDAGAHLPLVITPLQRRITPDSAEEAEARCDRSIYRKHGHHICWAATQ